MKSGLSEAISTNNTQSFRIQKHPVGLRFLTVGLIRKMLPKQPFLLVGRWR